MAAVLHVARYILTRLGEDGKLPVTTWKLQKLVYYSQAWSLVWDGRQFVPELLRLRPTVPCLVLYALYRGQFQISTLPDSVGDVNNLTDAQKETINVVLAHYAKACEIPERTNAILSNLGLTRAEI